MRLLINFPIISTGRRKKESDIKILVRKRNVPILCLPSERAMRERNFMLASLIACLASPRFGRSNFLFRRSPVIYVYRRSCIRRGGRCDHRPDDCCSGGACRCNLWGANCQCQRMGIFQVGREWEVDFISDLITTSLNFRSGASSRPGPPSAPSPPTPPASPSQMTEGEEPGEAIQSDARVVGVL